MRNNKTVVYGSSYDRGLEHLLKIWPDVKKEVPEAELRIFYGWVLFDRVYGNNAERQAWKDKINTMMQADGITHLGRISHEACVKEMETAGIWAYPTHFGEISCITAMRAQAFGAVPVVISYAALEETVQHGVKIDGDIYEPEILEEFKQELIKMLKDEDRQEKIRKKMMPWARKKYTWANVAKQWSDEFKSDVSLRKQVDALMDDNQALKAWELVKDSDNKELKDAVYEKVRHAFEPEAYKDYYQNDLVENPIPEDDVIFADKLYPRFLWLFNKLKEQKPKTLIDLGCADGAVPLTAAREGIKSVGVNLYKPSVELANKRAKRHELDATFIHGDIFDQKGEYDSVVLMEVLEHVPDPKEALELISRLLKKDGRAYISTPRTDHLGVELHKQEVGRKSWNDGKPSGHLRLFTEEEFKNLLEEKFDIVDFKIDAERCMLAEVKLK